MKATLLLAVMCFALAAGCGSDRDDAAKFEGSGGGDVEFEDFEEPLAEHGTWVEVEGYGECWYPDDVDDDWRPYCHGHWVWVDDCGWYWESDYEWGWACEHYGRWTHVHNRWYWVPGYQWSGAWVVWRDGGGYVGWAALPPTVRWSASVGIEADVHWDTVIYEPGWVFVAEVDFTAPRLRSVVVHSHDVSVIIHKTKVKGSISVSGGRAMNHAIKVHDVEKFTGKKAPRRNLEEVKADRPKSRKSDAQKGDRDGEKKSDRDTERKPDRDTDRDSEKKPERESEKNPERDTEKRPSRESEKQPDRDKKPSKGKGK
jgi:hypothetical protein